MDKYWIRLLLGNRGGGEEEKTTEVVPRAVEAPDPLAIARSQAQAQLETNPQLAQQYFELQQQFQPQLSELQVATQEQLQPRLQALQRQLMPQQAQVGEALAGRALQQLQAPGFISPEEQAAQEAIRGRETNRLIQALRTRANLGGGLFGGRAAGTEERAVSELGQSFAQQDIQRRQQAQQQAFSQAIPLIQQLTGTPITPLPMGIQGAAPSAESLVSSQLQTALASQPEYFHQFAQPSPWWGLAGSVAQGAGQVGAAAAAASSRRYKKNIKLWAKH